LKKPATSLSNTQKVPRNYNKLLVTNLGHPSPFEQRNKSLCAAENMQQTLREYDTSQRIQNIKRRLAKDFSLVVPDGSVPLHLEEIQREIKRMVGTGEDGDDYSEGGHLFGTTRNILNRR